MTVPDWIARFRAPRVRLPSWAQDAPARCCYATNVSGVWQLHSWDLQSGEQTPLTDKPTGVGGGGVLPGGEGVVWFDDHDGDEVGGYVVTPFGGGATAPLVAGLEEGWSSGLALRAERLAVGVAGRDGFRLRCGTRDGAILVYQSEQPASVAGLSRDAALLAVSHAEHGDVLHPSLKVLDASSGEVVADLHDGDGNTVVAAGWSRRRGDQRLAILADRTGRTRPEVWDVGSGQRRALTLDLPGEVWVADWLPDAEGLLLAHDHLGRTELWHYDLRRDSAQRLQLPPGNVAGARVRDDGALWYAFTSSADSPVARRRSSLSDAEGDDVLLTAPGQAAPGGRSYRSLHYDNGVGHRVHAFLATPDEEEFGPAPWPLVVDAHGGPTAQTEDTYDPFVQAYVDHGYAVLMPNYRGSTGYGKAWQDALEGDPGLPEITDLLAGRDHAVAQGFADPDRAIIEGASWGGYVALLAAGRQADSWACAVGVVPVADYVAAYEDESPELQRFDASLFGGTPEEVGDLYRDRSPITWVDQVRCPVLIITGRNDSRCPLRQVERYVEALRRRDHDVVFDVFEAGHGSYANEENVRQTGLTLDFLAQRLGTRPAQRET